MKTTHLFLASIILIFTYVGCSKTEPIPGVSNGIEYTLNGTKYAAPASFTLTTQTVLGATYTQVGVTSVNSEGTTVSLTFGFTSSAIAGYAGLATNPVSSYNLISLPNSAYKGSTKATSGTLNVTSYDGTTLNGTFTFAGSNFTITDGALTNTKKI